MKSGLMIAGAVLLAAVAAPVTAQVGGLYTTQAMACLPNSGTPGNIIVYGVTSDQIPAGTAVTVTYYQPIAVPPKGTVFGFAGVNQEFVTTYRTKHTMGPSDPEVIGIKGVCKSATYQKRYIPPVQAAQ